MLRFLVFWKIGSEPLKACHITMPSCFRRCRLEGPFNSERFPDFARGYPLMQLGEAEKEAEVPSQTDQRAKKKGPRSSRSQPEKKRSFGVVGSINLRIGISASTSTVASRIRGGGDGKVVDNAAVGDDDAPAIKRRRANKVTRRLRLGVGWVSLARLLGPTLNSFGTTATDKGALELPAAEDERSSEKPGDSRPTRQWGFRTPHTKYVADLRATEQEKQASTAKGYNCSSEPTASTTTARGYPSPVPMPTSGVSCRVTWFGECVASFELCPKTGLPLTPGECLLELPRGTAWKSCRLVLEVLATDEVMERPRMQDALELWDHLHWQHAPNDDGVHALAGRGRREIEIAERGPYHVLGKIVVGWQVRSKTTLRRKLLKLGGTLSASPRGGQDIL